MLNLYNTLTRRKEVFHPLSEERVRMYACGPTVYWFAHIGNMRAFLLVDILRRTLEFNGYHVQLVMNITDVGHLTDDEDAGEDKMLVAMQREGKSAKEIADFYTEAFFRDLHRLNILSADVYPRATEHIPEQIEMIRQLEENGFTYTTSDGVYFDTSKLEDYGKLSGQKSEEKQAGARVEMGEKKHATDFALWKFSPEGSKRQMEWESPWGVGFPGWHIECSAMSKKYLGVPFDVHTGGIDHVPVHHENELAQTQGCDGELEAKFWVHNEFLTIKGGKMSKSLGNLYTLEDFVDKKFDPLAYRYLVLGAHYRTKLDFSFEALEAAEHALNRLRDTVREWDQPKGGHDAYEETFQEALNDDLNTPQALAVMWRVVEDDELDSSVKSALILKFDEVFGLGLGEYVAKPLDVPAEVSTLVGQREAARSNQNWEESDRLREAIAEKGFIVEDTPDGPKLRVKR